MGVLVGVLASRAGWSSNDSRSWILVVLEATRTTLDHEIEHVLRSTSTSTTSEHDNASVCRIALKATVFNLGGFFLAPGSTPVLGMVVAGNEHNARAKAQSRKGG